MTYEDKVDNTTIKESRIFYSVSRMESILKMRTNRMKWRVDLLWKSPPILPQMCTINTSPHISFE